MIVISFGTFDVFHTGHLNILTRAKSYGDKLIVGVSSDKLNIEKKGFLPLYKEIERLSIIRALRCVDLAFLEMSMDLKRQYIKDYGADILVMGDDWKGYFDSLSDICQVIYLPRTPNISSTSIKERLRYPI